MLERKLTVQKLEKKKEETLKLKRRKEEKQKIMKARLYEEVEWTKLWSSIANDITRKIMMPKHFTHNLKSVVS